MKKWKRTRRFLAVFLIWMVGFNSSCVKSFEKTRPLVLNCTEEKLAAIQTILDTARVGTDDYTYPQSSYDLLAEAFEEVKTGISYARSGRFVLQYEVDNICVKADQAITQFLQSFNFTHPPGSAGELQVFGLNQQGSIDFGDDLAYSNANTYTVELWAKYDENFLDFEMATLIGTTSEGPQSAWPNGKFEGWNIHFQRSGNLRASMGCGPGVLEQARAYPQNFGQWNHIALVWDINAPILPGDDRPYHMKLYVNGELYWQKNNDILVGGSPAPMLPSSRRKMRAFIDPYHPSRCMTGYMKKFRLWKEAKTPEQLKALMTTEVIGTENNLECAWDFTVVPQDPSNIPDKTGRYKASINGSHKWMPEQ